MNSDRNVRLDPPLWHPHYIYSRSTLRVCREFAAMISRSESRPLVLDVGCGQKYFKPLFPGTRYLGSDIEPLRDAVDVVADNAALPFRDESVDGVIACDTLEHTLNYQQAVEEIVRVCKNGALVFVRVPFLFPLHSQPHDFQRFTVFKLQELFAGHQILRLKASNSIFTAWLDILGYGIAYASYFLPFPRAVTFVPQVLINCAAVAVEGTALAGWKLLSLMFGDRLERRVSRRKVAGLWYAMPGGYALIVRIVKNSSTS